jgi:hypothetical protein
MVNVKSELETIRLKNGGLLTEESILSAAKSKKHPLHDRFTWDDTEAARQWRLEEARDLIRSVYVTIQQPPHPSVTVRAYASLPRDRESGSGYRAINDIMSQADLRTELLNTALSELDALKKRYSNLNELVPVFSAIDKVKSKTIIRLRKPAKVA